MRLLLAIALAILVAACSEVPPESIGPIAKACKEQGLKVSVGQYQISCFKAD